MPKHHILEADTQNHIAFDVNKFRKQYDCENPFTAKEREIVFPMYKECIEEYRMTVNEFIHIKTQWNNSFKGESRAVVKLPKTLLPSL